MKEDSASQFNLFTFLDVPADLKPFVRRILYSNHGYVRRTIRIAPTGYMYIGRLFSGTEESIAVGRIGRRSTRHLPINAVIGVLTANDCIAHCDGRHNQLLVELVPTAYFELFHSDADGLVDQVRDIEALSPRLSCAMRAARAHQRETELVSMIAEWLEPFIARRRVAPWFVSEMVRQLESSKGMLDVMALYEGVGCSPRHGAAMFRRVVGVKPKLFAMMRQVNYLFELLATEEHAHFGAIALDAGFGDQSHCIRALRRFIAASPTDVMSNRDFDTMRQYLATIGCVE